MKNGESTEPQQNDLENFPTLKQKLPRRRFLKVSAALLGMVGLGVGIDKGGAMFQEAVERSGEKSNKAVEVLRRLTRQEPFTQPREVMLMCTSGKSESDVKYVTSYQLAGPGQEATDEAEYRKLKYKDIINDPKFPGKAFTEEITLEETFDRTNHEAAEIEKKGGSILGAGLAIDKYSMERVINEEEEIKKAYEDFQQMALDMIEKLLRANNTSTDPNKVKYLNGSTSFSGKVPLIVVKYSSETNAISYIWNSRLWDTPNSYFQVRINDVSHKITIQHSGLAMPDFPTAEMAAFEAQWQEVKALTENKLTQKARVALGK